jgi:hypothetical protein
MTASERYAKICKWLTKWIVLVLFALSILVAAATQRRRAWADRAVTL